MSSSSTYDGVCNAVLWPVLHYLIDRLPVALPDFEAYRAVNTRFAETLIGRYRAGDIIWIHDYHLMLTPAMVRAHLPGARIGFFFHTPFPAGDIFRVLPWRRELVEGVLGATLVGFQTRGDALNFAAAVRMLTNYGVGDGTIAADGRQVRFGAYPIGIDPGRLEMDMDEGSAAPGLPLLRRRPDRKVLVGVDRLDYTKGIPRRLAAFEQLLSDEPHLRGRVELFQLAVPSRCLVPSYVACKQEVQDSVDRVNQRFGTADWTPVRYVLQSVPPAELRAIYCAADVMLVTSLRDGMNLVAKEFVSCRTDDDGVLILSELAGAAEELTDALLVNPYCVDDVARAMSVALTLSDGERGRRMRSLRRQVAARPVHHWLDRFIRDLGPTPVEAAPVAGGQLVETIRSTASGGQRLSLAFVYEDALVPSGGSTALLPPDPGLLELLRELGTHPVFDLHVMSGGDRAVLGRWLELAPVTLWAGHGLWRRDPAERRWHLTQSIDPGWTADVREFLDQFTDRTPGSFVEERPTGFAWHFGRMEAAEGRARAATLFAVLREAADAMGFSAVMRAAAIEVRPAGLSTAGTVEKIVNSDASHSRVVLFAHADGGTSAGAPLRASDLLVTVGRRPAPGHHVLTDARGVRDVLRAILARVPAGTRLASRGSYSATVGSSGDWPARPAFAGSARAHSGAGAAPMIGGAEVVKTAIEPWVAP